MKVAVPWNDAICPQFQFTIRSPAGENTVTVDDSHREADIPLPAGVAEDDVEIVGCYLGRSGQPVPGCEAVLMKAAVERPEPEPATESKLAVEPEPECEYPRRRRMPAKTALDATSET